MAVAHRKRTMKMHSEFAKSVLRTVFKSLETFMNRFNFSLTCNGLHFCIFDLISSLNTKLFQTWPAVTGYGEFCVCFKPIRTGEIFGMNNNKV